jgi:branched-chain amino acid transport system permease protein
MFNLISGALSLSAGRLRSKAIRPETGNPFFKSRASVSGDLQHVKLIMTMSVLDNVALGAYLRGSTGAAARGAAARSQEEAMTFAEAATQIERVDQ